LDSYITKRHANGIENDLIHYKIFPAGNYAA